jgi:hypothetical protein
MGSGGRIGVLVQQCTSVVNAIVFQAITCPSDFVECEATEECGPVVQADGLYWIEKEASCHQAHL